MLLNLKANALTYNVKAGIIMNTTELIVKAMSC